MGQHALEGQPPEREQSQGVSEGSSSRASNKISETKLSWWRKFPFASRRDALSLQHQRSPWSDVSGEVCPPMLTDGLHCRLLALTRGDFDSVARATRQFGKPAIGFDQSVSIIAWEEFLSYQASDWSWAAGIPLHRSSFASPSSTWAPFHQTLACSVSYLGSRRSLALRAAILHARSKPMRPRFRLIFTALSPITMLSLRLSATAIRTTRFFIHCPIPLKKHLLI